MPALLSGPGVPVVNPVGSPPQQDEKGNIIAKKTYKHYKPQYRYDPQVPMNLSTKQALQPNTSASGATTELETLDLSLKKAFDGSDQQQRPSVLVSPGSAQLQEEPMDFSTKPQAPATVPQSPQALVCSTPQLTHHIHQLQCSIQSHPQTVNQIATVQSQSVQLQQQQQQQQPLQRLQLHVQQPTAQTQLATATAAVQPPQTLQQIILQQPSGLPQQQPQQPQLCISTPQHIQQLASQVSFKGDINLFASPCFRYLLSLLEKKAINPRQIRHCRHKVLMSENQSDL